MIDMKLQNPEIYHISSLFINYQWAFRATPTCPLYQNIKKCKGGKRIQLENLLCRSLKCNGHKLLTNRSTLNVASLCSHTLKTNATIHAIIIITCCQCPYMWEHVSEEALEVLEQLQRDLISMCHTCFLCLRKRLAAVNSRNVKDKCRN